MRDHIAQAADGELPACRSGRYDRQFWKLQAGNATAGLYNSSCGAPAAEFQILAEFRDMIGDALGSVIRTRALGVLVHGFPVLEGSRAWGNGVVAQQRQSKQLIGLGR